MPRRPKPQLQNDIAARQFAAGLDALRQSPLFAPLLIHAEIVRAHDGVVPRGGWAIVRRDGVIHVHPTRRAEPEEWQWVVGHCLLHLAFDHFCEDNSPAWNAACDCIVARFLADTKTGAPPLELAQSVEALPSRDEHQLARRFESDGIPANFANLGTAGAGALDMAWNEAPRTDWYRGKPLDWGQIFAAGLSRAVTHAVRVAAGAANQYDLDGGKQSVGQRARSWFISSYPLLGALAAAFELVEDALICAKLEILVAAIDVRARRIYINPSAGMSEGQCRFVMAHEFLHAALRHDERCNGRDHYLWNVSCDYVINDWLLEMAIGDPPTFGMLHDVALRGQSAEAIYDSISKDLRRYRKLQTMRGFGKSDILGDDTPWWKSGEGMTLDAWYRSALSQGLVYHQSGGRGLLPAGLVEEIRALAMPVVPWDVELAHWFDARFAPIEKRRSYARMSRRQSSAPDIALAARIAPEELEFSRTFGVVLDTSGSMPRELLGKALGTIASYAIAHEVAAVRVVFCDASAYDEGWMRPEEIAGSVKVRGRGGTILQPGVDLLESAPDFPGNGPILILTDAQCESDLSVHRDHAFVMPLGARLPFRPRGPVFEVR